MAQWEYLSTFIEANAQAKETREWLKQRFPDRRRFARYAPESLMPELDRLGAAGWELVHMEPVAQVGGKGDVLFPAGTKWGRTYFCVFKRQKPELSRPLPQQPPPAPAPPTPGNTE
jgi:hypothetical protein